MLARSGFAALSSIAVVTLTGVALGQGGEDPSSCAVIDALPFADTGTTIGFLNDTDEVCPYSGSTSPDVYYCYTPPEDQDISISLCNSDYDTKVYVYDDTLTVVACNDDACSDAAGNPFRSLLPSVPLTGGATYFVAVDGWSGDAGTYTIEIAGPPVPCDGDINGDGEIAFGDLLIVLSSWGPCPTNATTAPVTTSTSVDEVFGTATAHVADQSGLSIAYADGVTDFDTYLAKGPTHDSGPESNVWLMTGPAGNFDMDFGAAVAVDSIAIWNKDDVFGVNAFILWASNDPDFAEATTLATGNLKLQPSQPTTAHEQVAFGAVNARYFRLQILGNHGAGFTGLSEVVFRLACAADLDDNNAVDFGDLLIVLSNWGPCP